MPPTLHFHPTPIPSSIPTDPLSALAALAQNSTLDYTLLHSGPAAGLSVLAFDPLCTLLIDSNARPHLHAPPAWQLPPLPAPPLLALQTLIESLPFRTPHPLLGWLGFLSYDLAHHLETIPPHATDDLHWPLLAFTLFRHYLLFTPDAPVAAYTLSDTPTHPPTFPHPILETPPLPPTQSSVLSTQSSLLASPPPHSFEKIVRRAQEYIAAGDIYQANLAQRWTLHTPEPPHAIFRRLCMVSPAPYSACLRFTHDATTRHALSASPELFLSLHNNHLLTRPIKGTRPRDLANPTHDQALRDELLASPKDQAELAMIVDLLRNDLGRISTFGSVHVADPRTLEQHPTVWHTAATIESTLRPTVRLAELLSALLPGGSITGAPKIRATQIIEELEPHRRGLYCGHIGAIAPPPRQSLSLNIAIRTLQLTGNTAHLYAGAGIVADSDPKKEHEETLHKAAALFHALNLTPPDSFATEAQRHREFI